VKGLGFLLLLLIPTFSLNSSYIPPASYRTAAHQRQHNSIHQQRYFTTTPSFAMLRAWTCHGKTNRELVENLATVGSDISTLFYTRLKDMWPFMLSFSTALLTLNQGWNH
jgi:hypothetical protein